MKTIEANIGNWYIQCIPHDGARISVLRYEGQDLLTANPPSLKSPEKFYGEFETRPVFGYDDCFPSVDSCIYPDEQFEVRDHGELCWLEWQVKTEGESLICSTECLNPRVTFKRILEFAGNNLTWRFEVENLSAKKLPFLHVMHALLPLREIQTIKLPGFGQIVDEINMNELDLGNAHELANHLLAVQPDRYEMLLLREVASGMVNLGFQNELGLQISFDSKLFPTLGIWWNNAGYPVEEGIKRIECAFEPIPGTCSNLFHSFNDGVYLKTDPNESLNWEISWEIQKG